MIDHERLKSYIGKKEDYHLAIDYSTDGVFLIVHILWINDTFPTPHIDSFSCKLNDTYWLYYKFDRFT